MSITVSISAVQTHTLDVDADEMSNSRRSLSLIPDSVGVNHPCCWKPHGSLHSFSLTGTIFLSILSHCARIQSSRSQCFTSSNHHFMIYVVFISTLYWRLASKTYTLIRPLSDWSTAVSSHAAVNSDAHSIQISSQNIRIHR